jgi:SAM-dependent methyltransferase
MDEAFFRRWFPEEAHHHSGFHQELHRAVPRAGKVLDLGCGANHLLAHLRTPRRELWGADFDVHPQLQDHAWFRRLRPGGGIPFADATFDVVATYMVLEHVELPRPFFRDVARVLKPGGLFLGHTISGIHYVTWLRRLFDLVPHAWTQRLVRRLYGRETHDTFATHYRLNTPDDVARQALPFGLSLVRQRRYASPGYFQFSKLLCRGAIVADWLLDRVQPGLGRIYFSAVLRKTAAAPSLSVAA